MPAENPSANSQAERASRRGGVARAGLACGAGDGTPCISRAHRRRRGAGGADSMAGWTGPPAVARAASPLLYALTHLGVSLGQLLTGASSRVGEALQGFGVASAGDIARWMLRSADPPLSISVQQAARSGRRGSTRSNGVQLLPPVCVAPKGRWATGAGRLGPTLGDRAVLVASRQYLS